MPIRAAILGAYDRFNYGDLLFPLITARELQSRVPDVEIGTFALRKSDLSPFGAAPTRAIGELFDGSFLRDGDSCIVNGGGVLGVDWIYVYANTVGPRLNRMLQVIEGRVGQPMLDRLIARLCHGRSLAPFVASPADFRERIKVVYNAVGGGAEMLALPELRRHALRRALREADYLSVRDDDTRELLGAEAQVHLVPDAAVVMSRHFPLEVLRERVAANTLHHTAGPYMVFQSYLDFGRQNEAELVRLLETLFRRTGLPVVLLPIGRYPGLDDQVCLSGLAARLSTPHHLIADHASLFDIMWVIANAALFVGTSLHGQVTAQSYAVPHIGLGTTSPKLTSYLRTWGMQGQDRCMDPRDLQASLDAVDAVLSLPVAARLNSRDHLVRLARGNYARLFSAAGLDPGCSQTSMRPQQST
jgi:polysaccharide pyruvyl transferase WcaK-like protein